MFITLAPHPIQVFSVTPVNSYPEAGSLKYYHGPARRAGRTLGMFNRRNTRWWQESPSPPGMLPTVARTPPPPPHHSGWLLPFQVPTPAITGPSLPEGPARCESNEAAHRPHFSFEKPNLSTTLLGAQGFCPGKVRGNGYTQAEKNEQ